MEVDDKKVEAKVFTQDQVNAFLAQDRRNVESKLSEYEVLQKKVIEFEKITNEKAQRELESAKEYEKAKETYQKQIQERDGLLTQKDSVITDMKIGSALMTEIVRQNAYAEETMALIKQQAVFDKEGNIRIKGRDANGLEVMHSVEEGIKSFLTQRPHLVKATKTGGAGTGSGSTPTGVGQGGDDLNSLNAAFLTAQSRGDYKSIKELKVKMAAAVASQRR